MFDSLEEIAYNMGKKHDTGSAAFYRTYTSRGPATWVNEVKEADWSDLNNPTFTGRISRSAAAVGKEISKYWQK
eukprot:1815676-Prymnesium_polylepis.1